jgi:glycosyltransferase involved in cell wall biosynthesis
LLRLGTWAFRRSRELSDGGSIDAFGAALRSCLAHFALVMLPAENVRSALLTNGVPAAKIAFCPPGVSADFALHLESRRNAVAAQHFTVGYIGRLDPWKGVGILVDGFMRTRWPGARLRISGSAGDDSRCQIFAQELKRAAALEKRITFCDEAGLGAGADLYAGLSVVAIPSVGLETGPLVLFEALRAGVPLLVSDRIGHLDLLRDTDRVIRPNTPEKWRQVLEELFAAAQAGRLAAASEGTARPVRTMRDVAREVLVHYQRLISETGG